MIDLLRRAKIIFWDFDGVIKDSVKVKSDAFVTLFQPYGMEIAEKIRKHHEMHSGISRFDKIPTYLDWVGEKINQENVQLFCDNFAQLVRQAVIDSLWVPGVRSYLLQHYKLQKFVLVTATPELEIKNILQNLELTHCFYDIYGAPFLKKNVIKDVLFSLKYLASSALMVGDSEVDYAAAKDNHVTFLLRRTPLNKELQAKHAGYQFDSL